MVTQEEVREALKAVKYPGYSRDIVSFGLVKDIAASGRAVTVVVQLTAASPEIGKQIKAESEQALRGLPGVEMVYVEVRQQGGAQAPAAQNPWSQQNKIPGIQRLVAVASGKGGVGKSTVAANLAVAFIGYGAQFAHFT